MWISDVDARNTFSEQAITTTHTFVDRIDDRATKAFEACWSTDLQEHIDDASIFWQIGRCLRRTYGYWSRFVETHLWLLGFVLFHKRAKWAM